MNIFERLILAVNPKAALNRAYYKQLCRSYYDAAGRTRDNWVRGNTTGELTDRAARDTGRGHWNAMMTALRGSSWTLSAMSLEQVRCSRQRPKVPAAKRMTN